MKSLNYMEVSFKAQSVNEGFARLVVAGFCLPLKPNLDELGDIKTAVSEAVTNCVVHAYPNGNGLVWLSCEYFDDGLVKIVVRDEGVGIKDIAKAREPFFTTKPGEERSGMGFAVMESFMDNVEVAQNDHRGLCVTLYKRLEGVSSGAMHA